MASVPEKKKRAWTSLKGFSDREKKNRRAMQARAYRDAKQTKPKVVVFSRAGLTDQEKKDRHAKLQLARTDAKRTKPKVVVFSRASLSDQEKRDRRTEQLRQWRARNKERAFLIAAKGNRTRRTRKFGAVGSYTQIEWDALRASYANCCACCKQKKPLTADHVIPLSKGGTDNISNIQPLCRSCNSRKGTKTTDYR